MYVSPKGGRYQGEWRTGKPDGKGYDRTAEGRGALRGVRGRHAAVFMTSLLSTIAVTEPAQAFFGLCEPLDGAATGALIGGIPGGGSGAAIGPFSGAIVGASVQDERRRR
jgi:hypothetical protein